MPIKRPNTSTSFNRNKVPDSFQDIFTQIPHLDNVDMATLYERSKERLRDEEYFDNMMNRCNSLPLFEAFEPILNAMFQCDRAILWENRQETRDYHSNRFNKEIGVSNPIVQDLLSSKKILLLDSIKDINLAEQFLSKPDFPQLFFPLLLNNGEIIAIVQLTKFSINLPFDSTSEERAQFVKRKFSIYGAPSFALPRMILYSSELSRYGNLKATVDLISNSLKSKFGCQFVDFWYFNETMNLFSRYEKVSGFVNVYRCKSGIIGHALRTKLSINETSCRNNPNYLANIDGDPENPILIVCYVFDGRTWACALRGSRSSYTNSYSGEDEKHLLTLMPFITRSLAYSCHMSQPPPTPTDKIEGTITKTLNDSIEITSFIDIDKIIHVIENKFSVVLECEKVNILLVRTNRKEFITSLKQIFLINECLSGQAFASQKATLFKNPTSSEKFNFNVDVACENVSEIRDLLSFPLIFNNNCISVINFINKINGKSFSMTDIDRFNQFSSLCTCSIQNAMLNQSAIKIINSLQALKDKNDIQLFTIVHLLENILEKANETFSASFASIFLRNDNDYFEFLTTGKKIANDLIDVFKEKAETMTRFENKMFFSATPLIDNKNCVFGVLEIGGDSVQCEENIELIESFISIVAISFEQLCSEKVLEIGKEYELFKQLIEPKFRNNYDTPLVLKLSNSNIFLQDFNIDQFKENDYFKIIFKAFDAFALKSIFRITNQKLYFFLVEVFKYNGSIKQSIDIFQFLVSSLLVTHLDGKLSTVEILSMLASTLLIQNQLISPDQKKRRHICNKILNKNQNIHSINFLHKTVSKEECNIFANIKNNKLQQIWALIISLLKSINIHKHFKYVNKFSELVTKENFVFDNDNRILLMIILIKNAMYGGLARDFEIASKHFFKIVDDVLSNDVDLHLCEKLKYESGDLISKEKSIIPILHFFVMPSFISVSTLYPSYQVYVDSIQSNFAKLRAQQIESGIEEEEEPEEELIEETIIEEVFIEEIMPKKDLDHNSDDILNKTENNLIKKCNETVENLDAIDIKLQENERDLPVNANEEDQTNEKKINQDENPKSENEEKSKDETQLINEEINKEQIEHNFDNKSKSMDLNDIKPNQENGEIDMNIPQLNENQNENANDNLDDKKITNENLIDKTVDEENIQQKMENNQSQINEKNENDNLSENEELCTAEDEFASDEGLEDDSD